MSSHEYSDSLFEGPTYALVIGISTYGHGKPPQQPLEKKEFSNLKVAAQDAQDFAKFLRDYGVLRENVTELLNENASIANIKDAFDNLRKACKLSGAKDPLVIIYFAGHGMADSEERHYLIPFDAERDKLFGTALLNKDFSALLDHLNTNRLVVFIDACHAGAVGLQNARGNAALYDSHRELGEGKGRYIIRSCGPDQKSYEGEKNGIFTGHLLELLKGETDDFEEEAIDTFDLYRVLKNKVKRTAFQLYQQEQEPDSEMASATGIVLAINRRLRKKKQEETAQVLAQKAAFLERVNKAIRQSAEHGPKIIIMQTLSDFVDGSVKQDKFADFYGMFDEYFGLGQETLIDDCSGRLIRLYNKLLKSSDSSPKPAAASNNLDGFAGAVENNVTAPPGMTTPIATVSRAPGEDRRQFSTDDSKYILAEIFAAFQYYTQAAKPLHELLDQPVTEGEFARKIHSLMTKDRALQELLDGIVMRFQERWPEARPDAPRPIPEMSGKANVLLGRNLTARKGEIIS